MKAFINRDTEAINIGSIENLHIESLEVMTCDDDFNPTDRFVIRGRPDYDNENPLSGTDAILDIQRSEPMKPCFRFRFEPAVALILKEESGHKRFRMTIGHHKGSVMVRTEEISF